MRRIISKAEKERIARRNQWIIGIILVGLMVLSTAGYALTGKGGQAEKKIEYNGYEFINKNGLWYASIGNFPFVFRYPPSQEIQLNETNNSFLKPISKYFQEPLYISSENSEAASEIYNNFKNIALRIQPACLDENCTQDYPVKNCSSNFIIIQKGKSAKILQKEDCVFIQGPEENLTQITDEFLFKIIGIKE